MKKCLSEKNIKFNKIMNKYKIPDFITEKNFNEETLGAIYLKNIAVNKLSAQYSFQVIKSLFDKNKELVQINLEAYEEDDDEGSYYLNLRFNVELSIEDSYLESKISHWVYDCCTDMIDDRALSRIMERGKFSLKRDDLNSFKLLAEVLFSSECYVEEYFNILSKDDGSILATDYITSKNIDTFDPSFIEKELEKLQELDRQIAVLSIKKLFDDPNLISLEISSEKDEYGFRLLCSVGLSDNDSDVSKYRDNVYDSLVEVMYGNILKHLADVKPIKIQRGALGGLKALVNVLFNNSVEGDNFITALQRDELDISIISKEAKFVNKKCKI